MDDRITTVFQKLTDFLQERRVSSGGYAEITERDIKDLYQLIDAIIVAKCAPDPDGDYPIDFKLIDRTKYWPMHYLPEPYDHELKNVEDGLDTALTNLSMANNRVMQLMRLRRLNKKNAKISS